MLLHLGNLVLNWVIQLYIELSSNLKKNKCLMKLDYTTTKDTWGYYALMSGN